MDWIGIGIGFGACFVLLYSRKTTWFKARIIVLPLSISFLIGVFGFLTICKHPDANVFYSGLCIPLVYFSLDRILKSLSEKFQNRDLILWLRFSDEIDYSIGAKNPQVTSIDKVFSMVLLFSIMILVLGSSILSIELVKASC